MVLLSVAISLLVAGVAAYNRIPWSDEGWFSSAAYNLSHHGFMGTTVLDPTSTGLTRIDQRTYWIMPIYPIGQAIWYLVFPSTVFWTRAYTLFWVPILVWAFYRFLRSLFPETAIAPFSTILLACSFILIDNAGFARPDVQCCALGLSGLAAYVTGRDKSLRWALVISNAFIAASGLTHPNGIYHFVGLWIVVLFLDGRRLRFGDFLAAATPYLAFGLLWAAYILLDLQAFRDQMRVNGTNGRWTPTLNPFLILWNEIEERYLVSFGFVTGGLARFKAIALLFYLAAVIGVLFTRPLRAQQPVRLVMILWGAYFFSLSVFNQKLNYYLVHILPFYIALLGIWLHYLWERWPRLRFAIAAAVMVLLCADLGGILVKAVQRSFIDEQRAMVRAALRRLPKDGKLNASASLIYGFHFDPRLLDDPYLGLRNGRIPQVVVVDELYRFQFLGWSYDHPDTFRQVQNQLSFYTLAYQSPAYQVYVQK